MSSTCEIFPAATGSGLTIKGVTDPTTGETINRTGMKTPFTFKPSGNPPECLLNFARNSTVEITGIRSSDGNGSRAVNVSDSGPGQVVFEKDGSVAVRGSSSSSSVNSGSSSSREINIRSEHSTSQSSVKGGLSLGLILLFVMLPTIFVIAVIIIIVKSVSGGSGRRMR